MKKFITKNLFHVILTLNLIPAIILSLYLKYLEGDWSHKELSYQIMKEHYILSIWFLTHLSIAIGMIIYDRYKKF